MVGGGASMAITSITSWLTPTLLFCLLNLMIAIIFIASNFKPPHHHQYHHHHQDSPSQLVRSPSLLERVKSINFSSFYPPPPDSHEYNSVSQLTRPPSFLQRVKSMDLSFSSYYYYTPPPPVDQTQSSDSLTRHDSPSQLTRVPSLLERVKSFRLTSPFDTSDQQSGDASFSSYYHHTHPPVDRLQPSDSDQTRCDSPGQLARVPSFLERVKSFGLASPFNNSDRHSGETTDMDRDPHRDPTQDDDVVTPATTEKASPAVMTKSRSERRMPEPDDDDEGESDGEVDRRRPATMRASIGGKEECVDAKADDFIKRFKQQLKLQRLDSLQRFREMLNRGGASA